MNKTRSQLLLAATLLVTATPIVCAQDLGASRNVAARCSEISHRIACHAVPRACKDGEASDVFKKRDQIDLMILHLCKNGPKDFDKFYWIDFNGAYRPYYLDHAGRTLKFPPTQR